MSSQRTPTVAYIGGSGKSGSTILDMMLGGHSRAFSLGQVDQLSEWVDNDDFCTCNRALRDCSVWSRVLEADGGTYGAPVPPSLSDSGRITRFLGAASAVVTGTPTDPRLADAVHTWQLFDRVADTTGRTLVVDSSKNLLRLARLAATPRHGELLLVHVVRDPRGVVTSRSFARPAPGARGGVAPSLTVSKPVALADWIFQNLLTLIMGLTRFRGRYHVVSYERLILDPEATLTSLTRFLGLEFESTMLPPLVRTDFHLIGGNSSRLAFTELQLDTRWRRRLKRHERLAVEVCGGWLHSLLTRRAARQDALVAGPAGRSRTPSPASRRSIVPLTTGITVPCDCCGESAWEYAFSQNGLDLGRCRTCALHYISRMPDPGQRMTEMEAGHFAGELQVEDAQVHRFSEEVRRREFERYVDLTTRYAPDGRWLDIGCGTGTLIELARKRGIEADGIELTADRRELARGVTGATIYDQPLERLELPDESLAAVVMINVFSHLTSPTQTLAEIRRVLVPGGVVLVQTGLLGPGIQRRHAFDWSLGDHLFWLGEGTLGRYADKLGYELVDEERVWQPATVYTRERFQMKGNSARRNAIKSAVVHTPGALPLLRWYMLNRREVDNPYHLVTFVLRKPNETT